MSAPRWICLCCEDPRCEGSCCLMSAPSWICPCCGDPSCDGSCCGDECR
jgi:hypothetical protein